MDSYEFNKIAGGVLVALLVGMSGSLFSEWFIHPEKIEKNILGIEANSGGGGGADTGPVALQPITPLLAAANVENGKVIFKKCTQCHTPDKGGKNGTGPNLWGVVGAKIAHRADYAYSQGFQQAKGEWNVEELSKYLYKPREHIKGTKMSFVGLKDDKERADVIAYLQTLQG